MSNYIRLSTQEVINEATIRLEHPEIADAPGGLALPLPAEYARIFVDPTPAHNPQTHIAVWSDPICIDGVWRRNWIIKALTSDELKLNAELSKEAETLAEKLRQDQILAQQYFDNQSKGGVIAQVEIT